ncbi:MAG: CoA transferase [Rhodospirillaceae bacterium]|jgi:crotonobetainyl-CoA:carnitine CoA-transferase CaiB-like acyl-CoA transferase|nr:CoA transferase [Rhodospirillaceae bacterium]MBT5457432.1 CoA transferase [Rhodospirillaceae bacterium]
MTEASGPLAGVTVLDLTRILAGPFCTQTLGDLGADVIKIERPGSGDDTRRFAPPFLKDDAGNDTVESAYFMAANRNKRSVAVDISKPEGQALIRRIAGKSDVLVENFKLGNLARYKLGYDDLKESNPGLVYCSITGFGQTGPYAERPGYDPLIQAMGGFMSVTGEPEGEPMKAGVPIADLMAGMYASVAINAALRSREIDGKGQYIDIGMLDTQVAWLSIQAMNFLVGGSAPPRLGNGHPNIVPYQVFATADGHIMLTIGNDAQFQRFCEFAGCQELAADERFATNGARVGNRVALVEAMIPVLESKPTAEWLGELEKLTIGCGPINTMDQVFSDPHVKDREMVINMPHAAIGGGDVPLVASPLRFSETPVSYRHTPPVLGADTEDVLRSVLDMDDAELDGLRASGII